MSGGEAGRITVTGEVPLAAIFGCAATELSLAEKSFYSETCPLGFILFERNCVSAEQVTALVREFRDVVARPDAPVLIDQEGGRVARLKPPHWRHPPAASVFVDMVSSRDLATAEEAARLNATLIGLELRQMGISVNCAPVLDIPLDGADPIIGDRAWGRDSDTVAVLGRAVCDGLLQAGVLPVIKHIPGHGRATVDSHKDLPIVSTDVDKLIETDFDPFHRLSDMLMAMTAHVIFDQIDPHAPATTSARVIGDIVRDQIEFDGLLLSDDLSMKALSGDMADRARLALDAGCDIVLHCNGEMAEMRQVAAGASPMTVEAMNRWQNAAAQISSVRPPDQDATAGRYTELMAG